jgi:tetratricopeptide (TPR) repeat protein
MAGADPAGPGAPPPSNQTNRAHSLAVPPAAPAPQPTPTAATLAPPAATKPSAPAPSATAAPNPAHEDDIPADVAARATPLLKKLVARQDKLLDELGKDHSRDEDDRLQREIQNLIYDYDDFLRGFPKFTPAYVTYGLLLDKVGMRRQSVVILLKANELNPDVPIVKNQLGDYLAEEGNPIEAANYFISAIRLAPKEPLYHYQLGTVLLEGRDNFLKSGLWTRAQIDHTMNEAFKKAAELAPGNIIYAYSYAHSFNDMANPNWDEALKVWGALEHQCSPGLEKDTIRLQAANILIKQKKFDLARFLLTTVTTDSLKVQKQKLLDQLPANVEK